MVNVQEIVDCVELYKRNMSYILGEDSDQVQAINTCIDIIKDAEDNVGYWENIDVNTTDQIGNWQTAKCSKCGLYHTTPYLYNIHLYNFCPNCGADMRSKTKEKRDDE